MKIGFYNDFTPCIVKDNGVIDISGVVSELYISSPQHFMERIIVNFFDLKDKLFEHSSNNNAIPFDNIQLRAPVPRPGKVLCGLGNYKEYVPITPARPLRTFFKSPDAVIGPEETIMLPEFRPTIFNHEAELVIVIGKEAKK